MIKMKVVPVKVPWMISPSHDFASFIGYENREVSVQVMCGYNTKHYDKVIANLELKYGGDIPDEEYNKAGSVIIEIKFTPICLFNIYGKMDGYERYDFSIFDSYYYGGLSIGDEWNKTDICPNPGFYEVVESNLKETFGFISPRVKHWVLRGHDSCIDVLAYSFEWKEVEW
ncbi:hypothetical protein HP567_024850 [Brevibacillus sp. M2.1A]|uniref:hypothetical protein n=1 Tax=Brevibacillus TaxID=55080 RepID=UPI00156AEDF4|nr:MULTISPECIES: hypothetical protein [Brevibacillus]MBY0086415.1 hypothetical protein [Brevibacillus brevis]MCC8437766.1 hypothetical protein [Brevibacillus sp. M2.1A]MCE0452451.1 hypothetical protein [Brevibacillus sp. AF8]